jgi:hypothetical protein
VKLFQKSWNEKLHGYLDRLRENLEILDEAVVNAQKMARPKKKGDVSSVQSLKILRDLIELRNATLVEIKAHLLGRNETGALKEPPDYYNGNPEVMFERDFKKFLEPWQESDLSLQCEDCKQVSKDIESRCLTIKMSSELPSILPDYERTEYHDLCPKCYEKRITK